MNYHRPTLDLLAVDGPFHTHPVDDLLSWAAEQGMVLPAAYLEWASIDRGALLSKYSNDDWFCFESPELVTTPAGECGLNFETENQGNYDKIVLLDHGENPPVLFRWVGEAAWVRHAASFSECVYAQVFDWQYRLEFNQADPSYKEIAYYGSIKLASARSIDLLRDQFTETVSTRFIIEGCRYTVYRFYRTLEARITATLEEGGGVRIDVTGAEEKVRALVRELRLTLGDS